MTEKGQPPEWLVAHRELEYLRAAGSVPKSKAKKLTAKERSQQQKAKKRVRERYQKLREVKFRD